ncbi:hypothetical protein [Leifsonia sp. LS-T14]|uniref:hypothetical protein n=1 Tax=unclassified Leifsonia TaxID=2663824 RepID=UPI0035A6F910
MTDSPVPSFELLAAGLLEDPDLDVSVTATGLHVHGRLFAYLDGTELAIDLPKDRAADLVSRGVATPVPAGRSEAKGAWVRIADAEDWPELASESHQFVGEPAVGRES